MQICGKLAVLGQKNKTGKRNGFWPSRFSAYIPQEEKE